VKADELRDDVEREIGTCGQQPVQRCQRTLECGRVERLPAGADLEAGQ